MSLTIEQSENNVINPEIPLVFINIVHFSNNSPDNLVNNLGENNFYHLSQFLSSNSFANVQ